MSSSSEKSMHKRAMEADPTSGEEQVQPKKKNPGREEAPAPLPVPVPAPSAGPAFFIDRLELLEAKMKAKIGRDRVAPKLATPEIPTLKDFKPPTYFHTRELLHVREAGTKAARTAAKSLLGISSSVGGKPLKRCSGFWIDWNEESKTGIALTTAHLVCTSSPVNIWLGGGEYASHANVTVHLLDGTSAEGQLLYYQPHYDLAFVKVRVDQSVQVPSFHEEVMLAQEVFRLGRDNMLDLRITYGRAEYQNSTMYQRYHNMYFNCTGDTKDDKEYDNGGPVVDLDGKVVGMSNNSKRGTFIPWSILVKCVDLWKKYEYKYIPRPHLGMSFKAIKLLEPAHLDKIWRMYNIDDGLVVRKVSKGSHAEQFGIQRGDIIECINGKCISTTIELENMLASICKGSSDNLNDLNVEIHVSVRVFHTLKKHRTTGQLAASVSDLGEVIMD
ncbi:uncharacterized protein [Lolium perenne]|uniref:uncharacterized protein n=1 Tax=Lolium perenne TaxID=4522 RepID=UPI0021F5DE34|nr:uncharacterized protein LOC127294911 [Lolium perenne]XP_051180784.1 uncharacterized protein LOC127294911 [Lolium perenne]